MDASFDAACLEQMLAMAHESDARPVVLFNKIDLCGNLNARLANATCVAGNALVLAACAVTGRGVKKLAQLIKPGDTGVFIGTSGVGKSSLINRLYGEDILWMANSCPRSDWQLGKPGAKGLELLIFDHIPVLAPPKPFAIRKITVMNKPKEQMPEQNFMVPLERIRILRASEDF